MKTINPSFGQAVEFAFKTGYGFQLFLGVAIIVAAILFMVWRFKFDNKVGNGFLFNFPFVVVFAALAVAITLILIKPISIQTDNAKKVSEESYQYYQAKDDNFDSFWDSVYVNNKMIGAAVKR